MANMTFGVNLIPKNNNNTQQTLGNSENKWDIYANNINGYSPITGVKGDVENNYRTGFVNLTSSNIGAVAKTGDTMSGSLVVGASNSNTEQSIKAISNSGSINLFAHGTSNGNRGLSTTNSSGTSTYVISIDPSNNATFNGNITGFATGNILKTGDTMTGNLTIQHAGDTSIIARNDTNARVHLNVMPDGSHGIWSDGYYTDSTFVENGKYMIVRRADGKVYVADHYNKSEVESRGVLFTDVNIGTITINASGYLANRENVPSGITPIAAAIIDFGQTNGGLNITADGHWFFGAPDTTMTNVVVRFYYRG